MTMGELDLKTVRLLPNHLRMKEEEDMTLFVISSWNLELKNESNSEEGVRMRIVFTRKLANEIMTTFLPSVLLILITWATTFFKPYFFEAALSVNLTTMLVMTTIFIGVMQMLPSTAYVKMIDVWLIFGQLIPFAEVILLTMREYLREGDGSGQEEPTTKITVHHATTEARTVKESEECMETSQDAIAINPQTEAAQDQSEAPIGSFVAWRGNKGQKDKNDPVKTIRFLG